MGNKVSFDAGTASSCACACCTKGSEDGRVPEYVEALFSPERIKDAGIFDPGRVAMLLRKARASDLARARTRDNMAFMFVLSTMLLDEIFVCGNMTLSSPNAYS